MTKGIKIIIIVIVLALIAGGIFIIYNARAPKVTDCASDITTMTYTSAKTFAPSCIRVPSGTVITYTNQSSDTLLVAIDPHPIHTGNKEVSNGEFTLAVAPGASATTTVTTKGTFGIHDHANFGARATIVVE